MSNRNLPLVTCLIEEELWRKLDEDKLAKSTAAFTKAGIHHLPWPEVAVQIAHLAVTPDIMANPLVNANSSPEIKTLVANSLVEMRRDKGRFDFFEWRFAADGSYTQYQCSRFLMDKVPADKRAEALKRCPDAFAAESKGIFPSWHKTECWWEDAWLCTRAKRVDRLPDEWNQKSADDFATTVFDATIMFLGSKCIEKYEVPKKSNTTKFGVTIQRDVPVTGPRFITIRCPRTVRQGGERGEWQGGTHASPYKHLREAHHKSQHYGPGNSLVKEIFIEATWVNDDEGYTGTPITFNLRA